MNITEPIRHRARRTPTAIAVIRADDTPVSYLELDQMIDAAAARVDGTGLVAGQIAGLAIVGPDEFPPLVLALALARRGIASAEPVLPADMMDAVFSTDATAAEPSPRRIVFDAGWVRPSTRGSMPPAAPHRDAAAICRVFASSGTTGTAKFAAISHALIGRRVFSNLASMGPPEPVHICGVSFGITAGFCDVLRTLWTGGTLVLTNPAESVASIRRHQVGSLLIAPVSLAAVVRTLPDDASPILRVVETGGSLLSAPLEAAARAKLCDTIICYFGATETGGVASGDSTALRDVPGAVGFVHAGVEVEAVDADDRPLPAGVAGVLRIRGGNTIDGYFGQPGPAPEIFRDGWFYPGDVGAVSADGILSITGRVGDFINAGGIKVSPQVIESVLLALPEVTDAAAFGVPDSLGVTQIWAAIVAPIVVPRALLNTVCRERLGLHAPKFVLQMPALPRNANGKLARDELVRFALAQGR